MSTETKPRRGRPKKAEISEEERKKDYAERRKETNHRLAADLKAKDPTERRLQFIRICAEAQGYQTGELARVCGTSQQLMRYYLDVRDDCQLSVAENILDKIGIGLEVSIERVKDDEEEEKVSIEGKSFRIEGLVPGLPKEADAGKARIPEFLEEMAAPGRRLTFLGEYLLGPGRQFLYKRPVNIANDKVMLNLRVAAERDDIRVSQIYEVAEQSGGKVVWKVNMRDKSKIRGI